MTAVRHVGFSYFQRLSKIQINAYFYVDLQNLVKIGRATAELLRIFNIQYDGRPRLDIIKFSHFVKRSN